MDIFSGYLSKILFAVIGTGVALGAPVIPSDDKWMYSYEYPVYNTVSGQLEPGYFVRQFDDTYDYVPVNATSTNVLTSTTRPKGNYTEAVVVATGYKNVFWGGVEKYEEDSTFIEYKSLEKRGKPTSKRLVSAVEAMTAQATIAVDSTDFQNANTSNSITFAVDNSGGDFLVVSGHENNGSSDAVTGITYNGVSMTKAVSGRNTTADRIIYIYYLTNPATGSNNVVVSLSSTESNRVHAVSYTGVKQTSPLEDTNTKLDVGRGLPSAYPSVQATSTTANALMYVQCKDENGTETYTSTTSDTVRLGTDAGGHMVADKVIDGEHLAAFTSATVRNNGCIAAVFAEAVAAGGITPRTRVTPIF